MPSGSPSAIPEERRKFFRNPPFYPAAPTLPLILPLSLLLLFGYEIFNFSLSIDEELHSFESDVWLRWIAQGRWTMAILARFTPSLAAIPMLATVLFCAGIGTSAYLLSRLSFQDPRAQEAFVLLFVSTPIWPHIAEFNTLSWGVGVGTLLISISLVAVASTNRRSVFLAIAFLALSIGIYQSLLLFFLVLLSLRSFALFCRGESHNQQPGQASRFLTAGLFTAVGGFFLYLLAHRALLGLFHLRPEYLDNWTKLDNFSSNPTATLRQTISRSFQLLSGNDPIFLGYGYALMLLPMAGFLSSLIVAVRSGRRVSNAILVLAALGFLLAPIVLSAGTIPARALVAMAPFSAILGANLVEYLPRYRRSLLLLLVVTVFTSAWISISLFYSDHLSRLRDELFVARLLPQLDDVRQTINTIKTPLIFVGARRLPADGVFRRTEIFGSSFFEHDGGNPWRIGSYLRLLGVEGFDVRPITEVSGDLSVIEAMPAWPSTGSVAFVNGRVVVKLGAISPQQVLQLAKISAAVASSVVSVPHHQQSAAFFKRITARHLGNVAGKVELWDSGILIHPGNSEPTSVTFRLDRELAEIHVKLFIAPLDDDGKKVPEAGNVNVAFDLDRKPLFSAYIDRTITIKRALNVTAGRELVVRVDNANGRAWWDWFILSVESVQ